MGEGSSNSDDADYHNAFSALDDLRLSSLRPFFKENCLRDETLFLMQSEAELKEILFKELKLPFGHGFAFSRLWFQKYHNNKEATSCEGLPNTDIRKNHESSKRNHKQENEPSQVFAPPNGGHGRYRPEGNQNPTDSGKRETKICSEENNVEERNATATPMTEKANALNTADNHDSVSMTEQKHIKEVVGLKGSSSTEGQVIYSSGPFGLVSRTVEVGTVENDIREAPMFPQMHEKSVLAKLHQAEVVYLEEDGVGEGISNEPPMVTKNAFGVHCERVNELDAAESLQTSHQNLVKEGNSLMENSSTVDQTAISSGQSSQASMTLSPPGRADEVRTVENDIGEAPMFPPMHEQPVLAKLHQAEVVCLEEDGVGEGKATEPLMATKNGHDEQCERANELDAAGDLQMSDQSHIKEGNGLKENSTIGDQTATSSGQSISDKQGPKTSNVLIDCEVQEMSPKDESVSSEVMKTGSVCVVYNNGGNNSHDKGAQAVCPEESSGTCAKERATDEALKENENQPTNTTSISKPKGRKKKQKKTSKGASSTLTATRVKESKSQKADDDTCLQGQASMAISPPGKPDKVSTVENDIGETVIFPQMREQSVLPKLYQAEVVCLEEDGVGECKASKPPVAAKNGYDVQCERANELDAAGDLQMSDQNHVMEGNGLKENSTIGDQTATSSGQSISDKQGPRTSSVLTDCEVQEMSPGDESVSSEVTETFSACAVYNNDGNNNHEKEAPAVCSEEGVTTAKERATSETLKENVDQPTNTNSIAKPQGRKNIEKKGFKGASSTLTTTKAKDSEGPQNVEDNTCLEGQTAMTLSPPGRTDEVRTVENDIGEEAMFPQMHEQSVLAKLPQAEVVCLEGDGVGEGKTTKPPMTTKNAFGVQCERVNELDAAGDLQMSDQNHIKEGNGLKENSSIGDQTATSSGQSISDKQGPRTSSVLIDCDVEKIGPKDESVSSEVTEIVPGRVVSNNVGNNNHENGTPADESGKSAKERNTDQTLKENEHQSPNTTSSLKISKPKGRKKKQKKASKGASRTLTAAEAKDSEGPQNVDENTCLEGQASMTFSCPERAADVDISEARTPTEMHEHFVSTNVNDAKVVATNADVSLTTKVASEKGDCLGGSVQEEPSKTKPHQEPSFSVKNERAPVKEEKTATRQEAAGATNLAKGSTKVDICTPRPHGVAGRDIIYEKGSVLDAEENREFEFKSFVSAQPCSLPWKIMEKAKKFICACLNADRKGIIYFGVGDSQEQDSKYKHGEILGLEVEDMKDDVNKAFQFVLDDHIKSDAGPLQKGGEQNSVSLHFVPVKRQGNRTNLYVIEIEVSRDWRFCKGNVYYSKTWSAKRGVQDCDGKKLSDFFKVKDEYDDVAVRTNGASSCVKQHEVDRQVKKPLEVKYKEWRKHVSKHGAHELSEEISLDDADVKKFSVVLRERLRELNHKEYGYILVANKLSAKYRGTAHLSFLQNIPWLAVFDLFDAASKEDGLHYACNETTDAPRARNKTLDDFNEVSSHKMSLVSTKGTTWILNNEEMQKGDWIKSSKDYLYRAISAYKQSFPPGRLICVFLGLGENAVEEMADIMESCFSILGNTAGSCITIICERKSVADAFIKASKSSLQRELKECSLVGIPWPLFEEIVREMVGPSKFDKRGATTELPFYSGQFRKVLNKVINSWDDLEVYSPSPRLSSLAEVIEKERYAFYKGGQASQTNLFHEHSIPRTLETEISNKVERALVSLNKAKSSEYDENNDTSCHVKTIRVPYEPGSGATTLCRRILWKKRKDYRCAVVKAITTSTDYYIEKLQSIAYDEKNSSFSLPVLVLVDNFPESDARHLTERIVKRQTKCVVLSTFSITKSATISNFDVTPLRKLDETETSLVKNILINITSDTKRRREIEEVLEREKRFIWFGLELFGRDYMKIEDRLKDHINSILMNSLGISEMILNMCCFLHKYSGGYSILPHSVVLDFLYYSSAKTKEQLSETQDVHEIFGGLLLQEQNETHGYYGWRPAHSLVSEVVTSRISIEDTAVHFLEKICKCNTYVVKFLRQQVFRVLLERKRISEPFLLEEQGTDDADGSDFEDGVFGFSEVRTKYSPLIEDILDRENNTSGALRVLITICEEAFQTEDNPYAWQQLARFMGYEMRAIEMNESDDLHKRLHKAMISEKEPDLLPMPRTGIEAAHNAVDIAINHQPNYSHHYGTKGVLYLLQLSEPKEGPNLPLSLPGAIEICRKALEVYDKALMTSHGHSHHSMIGKIQAIVSLLKIVKGLPCFNNENESFSRFLQTGEVPWEMEEVLSQDDQCYVQSLSSTTLDLLNELFGNVKLKQTTTYDENEIRGLNNAKIRASKLRRTFYKITGYDRRQLSNVESSMPLSPTTNEEPALYQQIVQDILFIQDETPYSAWSNLSERQVALIYNLLKPLCQRGYGSHNDMLIFSKACLQLQERPPVNELDEIVSIWVKKFPDSEWAHLFNYMIHFPIPNGSLATYNQSTKASIKKCDSIVREKAGLGFRKSSAEYFLGKGLGLNAIVKRQEFDPKYKTKTEFWRSKETTKSLERVRGQKEVTLKGVITYQGIQLHFDNTLYPNESKDDLWFYIGFSVAGPYAYDPVDNDTYAVISRQTRESASTSSVVQSSEKSSPGIKVGMVPSYLGRGKPRIFENSAKPLTPPAGRVSTMNSSGDWQTRHAPDRRSVSSSVAHLHGSRCDELSNVDLPKQPIPGRSLYSSALRHEGAKKKTPVVEMAPKKSKPWKSVEGRRDEEKRSFDPKYVDASGRLRHGAYVRGLPKTQECLTHKGPASGHGAIKRCRYAHSWTGDTVQYVCTICSDKNLIFCKEKVEHKEYIWNLGPYLNASGATWKASGDSK